MSIYLVKYHPLNSSKCGTPPYVDASHRREPDFECEYPSISALCRGKLFAPKLQVGDEVIYITVKGSYGGEAFAHRRIVSHLRIHKRFDSHAKAAAWYREKIGKLPSNCMVPENPPLPLRNTADGAARCTSGGCGGKAALKKQEKEYQHRANTIPDFFACEVVWQNLVAPAVLSDQVAFNMLKNWERVRSRAPIKLTKAELNRYLALI